MSNGKVKDIFHARENNSDEELNKLNQLHRRATSILFKCRTVFPFDFFPNTIIIDHNKIDIIYREFFFTSQTVSILISNLNYIRVEASLFFSTLKIEVKGMEQNPQPIKYLTKKDAETIQNLLFGLMSAEKHNIDLSHLPKERIFQKLIEIGQAE